MGGVSEISLVLRENESERAFLRGCKFSGQSELEYSRGDRRYHSFSPSGFHWALDIDILISLKFRPTLILIPHSALLSLKPSFLVITSLPLVYPTNLPLHQKPGK